MPAQPDLSACCNQLLGPSGPSPWARFGTFKTSVAIFVETCADYYGAAALYEQLSALSDAELQQRGLSRATLAQDVCQTRKTASR